MLLELTQPRPRQQPDPAQSGRQPQPEDVRETPYKAWKKICVPSSDRQKDVCGLAYGGMTDDPETLITSQSPLIAVTVRAAASDGFAQPILILRTRLGLLLPAGLELQIDKRQPVKAAFRSCHASSLEAGCIVPIRIDGSFLRNLKNGLELKITARTLEGGSMDQKLSLIGITDALNALKAR